jgi:hypothetical protein
MDAAIEPTRMGSRRFPEKHLPESKIGVSRYIIYIAQFHSFDSHQHPVDRAAVKSNQGSTWKIKTASPFYSLKSTPNRPLFPTNSNLLEVYDGLEKTVSVELA